MLNLDKGKTVDSWMSTNIILKRHYQGTLNTVNVMRQLSRCNIFVRESSLSVYTSSQNIDLLITVSIGLAGRFHCSRLNLLMIYSDFLNKLFFWQCQIDCSKQNILLNGIKQQRSVSFNHFS